MPRTRHAAWPPPAKSFRNEPVRLNQVAPPPRDETTPDELAEIEWMLQLMESAECAMGCDYPDGPMSPTGCYW